MKRFLGKKVLGVATLLAIVSTLVLPNVALAADHADVTVTAKAMFLSITNTPNTWTINGIVGSGTLAVNTIYWSNPQGETTTPTAGGVVANECQFNVSNGATATECDLTLTMGAFTGGDTTMTNSDDGSNGATAYGAYGYYEGLAMANIVIIKSSGSDELYDAGLAAGASLNWGVQIETRTDAWTGAGASTATLTITATEH